jgi:hypothetical protein
MASVNFVNFTPPAEPLPVRAGEPGGRDRMRRDCLGSASPYAIATAENSRLYSEICEALAAAASRGATRHAFGGATALESFAT